MRKSSCHKFRFALLFCFYSAFSICFQQNLYGNGLDSLKSLLNQENSIDQKLIIHQEILKQIARSEKNELENSFNVAIEYAKKNKRKDFEAKYHLSYGMSLYFMGEMDKCLEHYLNALRISESISDKKLQSAILHEMGVFYNKNGMRKKAYDCQKKSIALSKLVDDKDGVARTLNSLGALYEYDSRLDSALYCYEESNKIYSELGSDLGMSYALNNIGLIYVYKSDFINAEKYLFKSLKLREALNDINAIAISYINIAEMYAAKKEYLMAIDFANRCISTARKINYLEIISYSYDFISKCYTSTNNFKAALEFKVLYQQLNDSIFNKAKSEQIAEMQTKYETEKKEQQIKIQELEISKRNNYIIIISSLLLIILFASYFIYSRYKYQQEARLQAEIIKQQDIATKSIIEAEERERKRIAGDLHDGIGQMFSAVKMNLSGVSDKISFKDESIKNTYEKTIALVDESCKEIRSISHNMMPNVLLKSGLASAIRDFIEKIDSNKLNVYLETEGLSDHIDSNIEVVLYRVIQELVNNVIKHSGADRLDIQLNVDQEEISVIIEDNGRGFDTNQLDKFDGIGLKNIITRVEFLKGMVEWDSAIGRGTVVSILIPLS